MTEAFIYLVIGFILWAWMTSELDRPLSSLLIIVIWPLVVVALVVFSLLYRWGARA